MNFTSVFRFDKLRRVGALIEEWCTPAPWIKKILHWFAKAVPVRLKARWSRLDKNKRHILVNMSIGLGISLALNVFHLPPWFREKEENALDWVIAMNAGTRYGLSPSSSDRPEHFYAFVDVDEWTYRTWGEPLFTPREKLAELIKDVVSAQPSLVIVDVELDHSNRDTPKHDVELQNILAGLPAGPPVILVKSLRPSLKPNSLPEPRQSFLDQIVSASDRLFWASPTFLSDDSQSIRRWKIAVCAAQNQEPTLLPSVQLLAYALLSHGPQGNLLGELTTQLKKNMEVCSGGTNDAQGSLVLGSQPFPLDENGQENRILYSMKQGIAPQMIQVGQEERPLFVSLPAQAILSGGAETSLQDTLHNRIVIIGGSFVDSHDIHKTPLGAMPGAMIILNSLRSLFTYGVDHHPSWMVSVFIEVGLIILMSFFFKWFNSFWGMLLSGAIIIVILLPASLFAFHYGVWLDFAIPLGAVQIHRLAEELKKKHIDHDNKGWR